MRAGISFQLWGEGPPSETERKQAKGTLRGNLAAHAAHVHTRSESRWKVLPANPAVSSPLTAHRRQEGSSPALRCLWVIVLNLSHYNKLLYSALLNKLQGRVATQTSSSPASPEPR